MSEQVHSRYRAVSGPALIVASAASAALVAVLWPHQFRQASGFVAAGLVSVAPLVVPGILLSAWIMASGADAPIARTFEGRGLRAIVAASAIGAITPVCGVTVLPLMAALLATGIPLAPVMAFWLASPITDPAMLATTLATLGSSFAAGKTIAAFGLGLWGGTITMLLSGSAWATDPLRRNRIVGELSIDRRCRVPLSFDPRVWNEPERLAVFRKHVAATTRLILICLVPAFAAEYVLNAALQPEALATYAGAEAGWAIPLAVLVGAPAYLDGYAALPLTRALIDHGMSPGAAMAFLVSGGAVSVWGAMAIFPVLRLKPFALYLATALSGSMLAGYIFDML